MATAPTRPTNLDIPFALEGDRNVIPDAPTGTNLASYRGGFPAVTMIPVTSGGEPPAGKDFNGIYYDVTRHIVWVNAGGQYLFDSALSTAMGGYPKGMVLQNNAQLASFVSLIDNNTTDFNSDPSAIGVSWSPYSGASFSNTTVATTGGNTNITAVQALANLITVTGLLTSNATITVPAARDEFIIINNTTNNFTLTCIASGGTGVTIRQGAADAVVCDGTKVLYQQASAADRTAGDTSKAIANTTYADRAASRVGEFAFDTGAVNAMVVASKPATTSAPASMTLRVMASHLNTSPNVTLDAGFGPKAVVRGDSSLPRVGDITTTMITNLTYVQSLDKWIINGLLVPDAALIRKQYSNSSQTFSSGDWLIDTSAGSFGGNLNPTPIFGDYIQFADAKGTFRDSPFTLIATGGLTIKCVTNNGTLWQDTVFINNVRGHVFSVWFSGTVWELS